MNKTADPVRRYIVIHQQSGRIVATCGGTHGTMERVCSRLDREHAGTYLYDDAMSAANYLPQVGPNLSLTGRR